LSAILQEERKKEKFLKEDFKTVAHRGPSKTNVFLTQADSSPGLSKV